jgi:sugar lactone lactonase YvrE
MTWEPIIDGIDFGEGPRWHDGRLWFSDFYQHTISSVGSPGDRRIELVYAGQPSGLGWLPDGRLLFVSMLDHRVMRREADGSVVCHADLSSIAGGLVNDMVVDLHGNAYVGNFGFDLVGGEAPRSTSLALVRPDGSVDVAAHDVMFPNGSVITDDGSTLIVGETFGARYAAYDIADDATLSTGRVWAEVPGSAPDGCTIDAENAIWFSDALGRRVVRVLGGGEITDTVKTPNNTYACMLGGDDGRSLYALTCDDSRPEVADGSATGALFALRVDVPRGPTSLP